MAEVSPDTIGTIVGVSIGVLSFFASNAIEQIREYENPYLKFGAAYALALSYIILLILVLSALKVGTLADSPTLMTGLYFVFIAFYFPSLWLFVPLFSDVGVVMKRGEVNNWWILGIIVCSTIFLLSLVQSNPFS